MSTVLNLHNVNVVRGGRNILRDVSWSVNEGERWVVLGPNGAGKSTLLSIAAARLHPSGGEVEILDETLGAVDVFELRPRIGISSAASATQIPGHEKVSDVVVTAAYAVSGRWKEEYEAMDDARATELLADWLPTGKPLLGICVGHQIFFESGSEHGVQATGLGIWPGRVQLLAARRLPHMGWNRVEVPDGSRIFASVETERFYFVHSYAAPVLPVPPQPGTLVTTATHETTFIAAVESAGICSTQFHPEKSGAAGVRLLRNWLEQ